MGKRFVISKLEGLEFRRSKTELYIIVNDSLHQEIQLTGLQQIIQVPRGNIRILLRDSSSQIFIGSVSFDSEILPDFQSFFLPIFQKPQDKIHKISQEIFSQIGLFLTPDELVLSMVVEQNSTLQQGTGDSSRFSTKPTKGKQETYLQTQMKILQQKLQLSIRTSKQRQDSLLDEIQSKNKQILLLQNSVFQLENQIRSLKINTQKPSFFQNKKNPLFTSKRSLNKQNKAKKRSDSYKPQDSHTEKLLQNRLKQLNVQNFQKCGPNLYLYNRRKVLVERKQNSLVCKVGGGYQTLEDFIRHSSERKVRTPSLNRSLNQSCLRQTLYQIRMAEYLNYVEIPQQTEIPSTSSARWGLYCVLSVVFSIVGQVLIQYTDLWKWQMILISYSAYFVVVLVLIAVSWFKMCCKLGIYPVLHHSTLYSADLVENQLEFTLVRGVWSSLFSGIMNFLGYFGLFYVLSIDEYKGLGFVGVIVVLAPIFMSVLNLLFYDQGLTITQLIGIIFILVGTQTFSLQWNLQASPQKIIGSCICLLAFIGKGILNKHAAKHQFDEHTAAVLGGLVESVIGIVTFGIFYVFEGFDLSLQNFGICSMAGVSFCLSTYFITRSIMEGNSGVSFGVSSVQIMGCTCISNQYFVCPGMDGLVIALATAACTFGVILAVFGNRICRCCVWRIDLKLNSKPNIRDPLLETAQEMERYYSYNQRNILK